MSITLFAYFLLPHVDLRCSCSRTPLEKRTYFRRIPDSAKKVKTFDYIVNYTNQYAVGPLDFDGIGYIYHRKYVTTFSYELYIPLLTNMFDLCAGISSAELTLLCVFSDVSRE